MLKPVSTSSSLSHLINDVLSFSSTPLKLSNAIGPAAVLLAVYKAGTIFAKDYQLQDHLEML